MSYITLYRKYRPQIFDQVIGQEHVTTTLKNAVDNDKVAHAYLFCGPRGTGKTSTARLLAKAVNCLKGPTSKPCGKCLNCTSITAGNSMDVLEIDAASNRGIGEIRDLREKINFAPSNCLKKIYIIDEVHMLTVEASNALLKMMEEPPKHVIFILATTEPHKVLPTILSRCQRFDFRRVSTENIVNLLKEIAGMENIDIEETCLNLISKQSQGSVRDAIGVLDQLGSYSKKKIKEEDVLNLLNIYEDDLLFDFAQSVIERKTSKALKMANQVIESGRELRHFVNSLIEHFREIFLLITTEEAEAMIAKSRQSIKRLKGQAQNMESWEALKTIDLLSKCSSDMRWSTDTRLLFEIVLVKLTKLEADLSLEGLLYRIEELEKKLSKLRTPDVKIEVSKDQGTKDEKEKDNIPEKVTTKHKRTAAKQKEEKAGLDMGRIKRIWPIILEQVKKQSVPLYSLLLQCHPSSIDAEKITLEFNAGADFHMKEIEKPSNQTIINKALTQTLGKKYGIICVLGNGGKLQKREKATPKSLSSKHTIKLTKDAFGAEIIEESSLTDTEVSGQRKED